MTLSRRELALGLGAALAAESSAQTSPSQAQPDLAAAAREANKRNSEVLAKFQLPIETEPAAQFRAL